MNFGTCLMESMAGSKLTTMLPDNGPDAIINFQKSILFNKVVKDSFLAGIRDCQKCFDGEDLDKVFNMVVGKVVNSFNKAQATNYKSKTMKQNCASIDKLDFRQQLKAGKTSELPAASPQKSPAWPAASPKNPPGRPAVSPQKPPAWSAASPQNPPVWPAISPLFAQTWAAASPLNLGSRKSPEAISLGNSKSSEANSIVSRKPTKVPNLGNSKSKEATSLASHKSTEVPKPGSR